MCEVEFFWEVFKPKGAKIYL